MLKQTRRRQIAVIGNRNASTDLGNALVASSADEVIKELHTIFVSLPLLPLNL